MCCEGNSGHKPTGQPGSLLWLQQPLGALQGSRCGELQVTGGCCFPGAWIWAPVHLSKGVSHPFLFASRYLESYWKKKRGNASFLTGDLSFSAVGWLTDSRIATDWGGSWLGCVSFSYAENYFEIEVNNSNLKIVIDRKIIQYLVFSCSFFMIWCLNKSTFSASLLN